MDQKLRETKIECLEKIAKNVPHLTLSIALTPVVCPYIIFKAIYHARTCDDLFCHHFSNFYKKNKLINLWKRGFNKLSEARKYNQNDSELK